MSKGQLCELEIKSVAFGGDGVGHRDGKVVFVPFGAPGDQLRVRITKETTSYCRAEIVDILALGAERCEPPCPYFGHCGGCQWQHIAYHFQAIHKSEIFLQTMGEIGVEQVRPLTKAPAEFHYRRRARMHWQVQDRSVVLGYYRWRSNELLNIDHCLLMKKPLQQGVEACRFLLSGLDEGCGTLSALQGAAGDVHLSLRAERADPSWFAGLQAEDLASPVVGAEIRLGDQQRSLGRGAVNLMPSGMAPLWASSTAFTQANPDQDRLLRQRVRQWAEAQGARVLELFAGVGNLTYLLATDAESIIAVESSFEATRLLEKSAAQWAGNTTVCAQDAVDALHQYLEQGMTFDVAVLDPPREGCPQVCNLLGGLGLQRIVYVACDPMTLARDLSLLGKHGFTVAWAQPQDMLPQTYHLEAIVLLRRENP